MVTTGRPNLAVNKAGDRFEVEEPLRDVDGLKIPYKVQSVNQFQTVTITFTKVEQNAPIDDKMFAKPE